MLNTDAKVLVFIPAYNCAQQIVRVLRQFEEVDPKLIQEILVVDNRSTDATFEAAISAAKNLSPFNVSVIKNSENYNLGGSHKLAFNYCLERGFTHCVTLHGDDQGKIQDLLRVLNKGMQEDCFLGSRFQKGSQLEGYGILRILANYFFNALFSLIAFKKITDLGSGLNMYSASYLRGRFYLNYPNDLTFNHFMLMHAVYSGSKMGFFPISWREEDQVSNTKLIRFGLKTLVFLSKILVNKSFLWEDPNRPSVKSIFPYELGYQHFSARGSFES